jgi:tRNA(Ile)-lysidine synthase
MAGPHPCVAASRTAVRAALRALPTDAVPIGAVSTDAVLIGAVPIGAVPTDAVPMPPVLVACSGGADSLALAAATAFVAPRLGRTAGAVVVDHGWHRASAEIAARAAQACTDLGLAPVDVVRLADGARPGRGAGSPDGGPEAAARTARYAALAAAADRHGAAAVLLGHTLDDQAESVLLGLARGSGGRSLAGMPGRRTMSTAAGDVLLLRPLLGLRRVDTEQVCAELGLTPWQDPSNTDPAFARSRLRAAAGLLDDLLGPGVAQALARTADLLAEDADALDAAALALLAAAEEPSARAEPPDEPQDEAQGHVRARPASAVRLEVTVLAAAPAAVRRRALLLAARRAGSPAGALGRRHVLALDALVVGWRGQGAAHLPGRVVGRRDCGRLLLATGRQGLAGSDAAAGPDTTE